MTGLDPPRCPGRNGKPCGKEVPRRIGVGRPIKFCDDCRRAPLPLDTQRKQLPRVSKLPNAKETYKGPIKFVDAPPTDEPVTSLSGRVTVYQAYHDRLVAMKREKSPEGLLVLSLAQSLDSEFHTGAARAALSAKLMQAWKEATAGAPVEEDALDELARKRRARFGNKSG